MRASLFLTLLALCGVLSFASCKSNDIAANNTTTTIGQQCNAAPAAGDSGSSSACASGVCTVSYCRTACTTDSQCMGAVCLSGPGGRGCQVDSELTCSASKQCMTPGLVCGDDGTCRNACNANTPCTVPGDKCLTDGVCHGAGGPGDGGGLQDATVAQDAGGSGSSSGAGSSSGGSDGGGAQDGSTAPQSGNPCQSPQTAFGSPVQGDSNANFTSGVGVRTADKLLIFSGYAGAGDGGDAGPDNHVYIQAFDPMTARSLGSAQPLFDAPNGDGVVLESASVAPTGQIALAFSYGGPKTYLNISGSQNSLYAAFLGPSDAGPTGLALQGSVQLLAGGRINGQSQVVWSVATGSFVYSWHYQYPNGPWLVGTRRFNRNGQGVGGTDPVPTDQSNAAVFGVGYSQRYFQNQGSVGAGLNLFGVAFQESQTALPWLTILDLGGAQVGNAVQVTSLSPAAAMQGDTRWLTVAATAKGFVYLYDDVVGPSEVFIPISGDAGVLPLPDAGDAGFAGFHRYRHIDVIFDGGALANAAGAPR